MYIICMFRFSKREFGVSVRATICIHALSDWSGSYEQFVCGVDFNDYDGSYGDIAMQECQERAVVVEFTSKHIMLGCIIIMTMLTTPITSMHTRFVKILSHPRENLLHLKSRLCFQAKAINFASFSYFIKS